MKKDNKIASADLPIAGPTGKNSSVSILLRLTVFTVLTLSIVSGQAYAQSPGGIGTTKLWLKADAGVFNDNGTTPASDGNGVSQWNDQSGNGNNADDNNVMPKWQSDDASGINFNPVVSFRGSTGDRMTLPIIIGGGAQNATYFVIYEAVNAAAVYVQQSYTDNDRINPLILGDGKFKMSRNSGSGTTPAGGAFNNPYLSTFRQTISNNAITSYQNGAPLGTIYGPWRTDLNGNNYLGARVYGGAWANNLNGDIAELIICNSALSATDLDKVESYLALKYGITLVSTDYVASDGTEMWNATTGAGYNKDIFGIGRDDASALGQVKSKSVNSDAIVTIEAVGEGTNATNAFTDIADMEFLTFGNNNGALTYQTTEIPAGPGGVSLVSRLTREWQVQETGDVGDVEISVEDGDVGSPEQLYLLIDDDGDFSSGATFIEMTDNAGIWEATVDLTDGQYFTFAQGNLALWLKADAGTSTTTDGVALGTWTDQSANGFSAITVSDDPTFRDNATDNINFNPVVDFNNNILRIIGGIFGVATYNDIHVYTVRRVNTLQNSIFFIEPTTLSRVAISLPWGDGTIYWDAGGVTSPHRLQVLWGGGVGDPNLWSFNYSTGTTPDGNKQDIARDGLSIASDASAAVFTGTGSNFSLGSGSGKYDVADHAELIFYTGALSAAEHQRIESYLALKYGITLDQTSATDYLASDGTTEMWDKDATGASTYNNDIAGIGRDDGSVLGQVQSKSVNTDAIVTILAESEGTNGTPSWVDIVDLEFLTYGNNDGAASWTSISAPTGYQMLSRQWSVQETGEIGTVQLDIDVADADFDVPALILGTSCYFVYDSDNDGDLSDETPVLMTDQGGDVWRVSGINFDSGEEFTIATRHRRRVIIAD